MRDNICIRQFALSDIDQIIELENSAFGVDAFSRTTFVDYHKEFPEFFIVWESSGVVIAYMLTEAYKDIATVISIAVDPNHRRQGIGTRLFDYTLRYLESAYIGQVKLRVRKSNYDAIKFWELLDFQPDQLIPDFYIDGGDALQMIRSLSA